MLRGCCSLCLTRVLRACMPFTTLTAARVLLVTDLEDGPDVVRTQSGRARQGDLHHQVESQTGEAASAC